MGGAGEYVEGCVDRSEDEEEMRLPIPELCMHGNSFQPDASVIIWTRRVACEFASR
jgi:hypothetical protein